MLDWDGVPVNSVALASRRAIENALRPKHGGMIVDELVTMPCHNEPSRTYAWRYGDAIELCSDGAYITRIGQPGDVFKLDLEMISRAGDEWPDSVAIASSVTTETSARTETDLPAADDIEEAFTGVQALGNLVTGGVQLARLRNITPRMVCAVEVDRRFDEHFRVHP